MFFKCLRNLTSIFSTDSIYVYFMSREREVRSGFIVVYYGKAYTVPCCSVVLQLVELKVPTTAGKHKFKTICII